MTEVTMRTHSKQNSDGSHASTWGAEQHIVAEGLRANERRLQLDLRAFIRSLDLASHPDGVEALLPELFSATFDTAIAKADRYNTSCSLIAWLRQVAFNCVREHKRKIVRVVPIAETLPVIVHSERENLSEGEMFDLLQKLSYGETSVTLNELLPAIPPAYHIVLRLHIEDGLVGRALATRMGTSEGAAATKLSRARDHLATAYHKWQAL